MVSPQKCQIKRWRKLDVYSLYYICYLWLLLFHSILSMRGFAVALFNTVSISPLPKQFKRPHDLFHTELLKKVDFFLKTGFLCVGLAVLELAL